MKNKMIEAIRWVLIKTVLPYRRYKNLLFSKISLSMTNRIAMNYLKLLIINGIIFFGIFIALYINVQTAPYSDMAERVIVNMEISGNTFEDCMNQYVGRDISVIIFEKASNENKMEVFHNVPYELTAFRNFFETVYLSSNEEYRLITSENFSFQKNGIDYNAKFYYNMTSDYHNMWRLFWNMLFVYLLIVAFIIREGQSDNVKMLAPIKEMTDTANRLTMMNLHSERLNIEGMKSELKDLAVVFNEMLDRMETSYESQKQFVSDASHELRTPIAVVQGYASMLNRWGAKDPEVLQESIDALQNEAHMMQDLVEKLLFLSRHDKKTLKLEKQLFNMRPIVEEMVKETKMVVTNRIIEVPVLEDIQVYGDKQSLKQAIRVLIDNATKYSCDGDKITITCRNVNGDCVIGVEDSGIGMTRKDMDNMFNRFYRSDDVRNRKIDGHGLGLSIAKLIIMAHTGRIHIRSQYSKGTRFLVTIPRRRY